VHENSGGSGSTELKDSRVAAESNVNKKPANVTTHLNRAFEQSSN
jgi:hypothetical protein